MTKPKPIPKLSRFAALLTVVVVCLFSAGVAAAHEGPGGEHPTRFTDVHAGDYYVTAVDWMVRNGITTGTSPTTFTPDRYVTRGEAAAFLWRASCKPAPARLHSFDDVGALWQQNPVSWLQLHGAAPVQGAATEPDSMFGPSTPLTRAQIAAMLYAVDGAPPEDGPALPFTDVTAGWQIDPVRWLLHRDITTGTSPTTFHPDRNVTRAEFATFVWRYLNSPEPDSAVCGTQQPDAASHLPFLPARVGEPYMLVPNYDDRIIDRSGTSGYYPSHPAELQIGSWRPLPEHPHYDDPGYRIIVEFRHAEILSASNNQNVHFVIYCFVAPDLQAQALKYRGVHANGYLYQRYAVLDDDGRWRVETGNPRNDSVGRGGNAIC